MTQIDLEEWLTSSQGDIPASPSRLPGSDEAIKMTDTSGRKCLGLSKLSGPAGSLERMLLATSLWASTRCYLTWKAQATPAGATLYRLSPQMPRTDETGSGLLHTPTAKANQMAPSMNSGWREPKMWATLGGAVRMWPTPDASDRGPRSADLVVNQSTVQRRDSGQKRGIDLQTAAKLWPTPIASEAKTNKDIRPTGKSNSLTAAVMDQQKMYPTPAHRDYKGMSGKGRQERKGNPKDTLPNAVGGSLNPNWVEWLMGYPVGYTDLNS